MQAKNYIENYCRIKNGKIYMNGKIVFEDGATPFREFIKHAYRKFNINYPRFFKMDNLSKLGFIAAELIMSDQAGTNNVQKDVAIVFSNKSSSLDTDLRHQAAINNVDEYFPSPSVFVYTLPNICIGEISIKHKLHSENSFFIFNRFNAEHLYFYSSALINEEKADKILCGWLEIKGEEYDAFLYMVSKKGILKHTIKEINKLYNA